MVNLFGINLVGSGGGTGTGGGSSKVQFIPVTELPAPSDAKYGAVYLLASGSENDENLFDEYIVVNDRWEKFGSGSASVNGNVVSSVNTEEVTTSVEESIMTQYGTSIAQLGLELSEIKESMGSGGGGPKIFSVDVSDEEYQRLMGGEAISANQTTSEIIANVRSGDIVSLSANTPDMNFSISFVISYVLDYGSMSQKISYPLNFMGEMKFLLIESSDVATAMILTEI